MKAVTPEQALKLIREHIEAEGSLRAYARKHALNAGHVSETLSGKRSPSDTILGTVGLERATGYVRRDEK